MIDLHVTRQSEIEINWLKLDHYVKSHFPSLKNERMKVKQFTEGYSNLTYLIQLGAEEMVLRRPPFGNIPQKAHDMAREFSLLSKIHPHFPLAPKPYLYEEDASIMEKHFYVMERKEGAVLDDAIPSEFASIDHVGEIISETVIDTMSQLHSIDIEETGLITIGKPEAYLQRQVEGWIRRYDQSRTDDMKDVHSLTSWLREHIPVSPKPTVIHNDFKLNNMMLSPNDPSKAVAVFDWEMCTVGDPLSELAITTAYWTEPGDPETGLTSVTDQGGFLSRKEMIHLYSKKTGLDVSNIDYYLAFAFFKTAIVLQQLYYRSKKGEVDDPRFAALSTGIDNLLEQAQLAKAKRLT